jgi:SCP-2 sterol transfer family protein
VIFPSEAWLRAVVEAVNRHPELPSALAGLGADLGAVVEPTPPHLGRAFAVYGRQQAGRIAEVRVLADEDDLLELEPAYVVRASYGVWKALVRGEDPVRAALSGRVRVEGDLQALLRRAGYRPILVAALATVATEFADEGEGT